MKALAAKLSAPWVQRYMLMFASLILGIVTCTMLV